MAIQLIINREWGLAKNENPNQGAFIIEELTDLVEEAVLKRVRAHRRARRRAGRDGDRLPARQDPGRVHATTRCTRSTTASYPIVGVNTFRNPHGDQVPDKLELARSTEEEKQSQLKRLHDFQARNAKQAPAMLERLQQAVIDNAQRVRGADGRGARLLAGTDHQRAVRGGRPVPPEHVTGVSGINCRV